MSKISQINVNGNQYDLTGKGFGVTADMTISRDGQETNGKSDIGVNIYDPTTSVTVADNVTEYSFDLPIFTGVKYYNENGELMESVSNDWDSNTQAYIGVNGYVKKDTDDEIVDDQMNIDISAYTQVGDSSLNISAKNVYIDSSELVINGGDIIGINGNVRINGEKVATEQDLAIADVLPYGGEPYTDGTKVEHIAITGKGRVEIASYNGDTNLSNNSFPFDSEEKMAVSQNGQWFRYNGENYFGYTYPNATLYKGIVQEGKVSFLIFNPRNIINNGTIQDATDYVETQLALKANSADLATVATSGSYNDLMDKPTIPTVPTNVSAFTNDAGYLTQHQSLVDYYTKTQVDTALDAKQDVISDLSTIRSNATNGNTALTNLGGLKLVSLTQTQYDALTTKDSSTVYFIKD